MKAMVSAYVSTCDVCQRVKVEHLPKPGLLQSIPIPQEAWEVITMDFIEGLPQSKKANCILVIIDKFTKYAYFLPLFHPYTAMEVARMYLDQVYKLHGQPKVAISDRDRTFTSHFWREFMLQLGTTTLFSTTYHPKTDGQSERLNQCLEHYLRSMCFLKPSTWANWLSQAEWWYNTTYHTSLGTTPFEALYGYKPPLYDWSYTSVNNTIQELNENRQTLAKLLKDQLEKATN
ncbi:hypothetical protein HRI_004443600 [Hibiscus trionum]|uniref:Integrase catalytic domain-containing protein n=1 Tax=Hibiscus trionum TaxID=183268 RepID=A0A9W7J6G6_HIBTR|nr:hypothetical protein HRI_004443600 [Hibiscus trionum]